MDKNLYYMYYMQKAIEQAEIAAAENEVPVGAVIVRNDEIIACLLYTSDAADD